ncbi:DUF6913 domain-containing protein [Arenibacter certesii]|uniref:Uncharacterized protein n=1 Tax=Arenibacter certesii TaxID=228955 RepID=A0A918J4Y2_9FLAO|nr:hypothetical protein [Arenibacter certesii]GGW43111.1 hypothetical protein GCM10007383_29620 [Arenibacter certesii]
MFLKKIKNKLKVRAARKYLRQELGSPSDTQNGGVGIGSIGCIVDLDKFNDTDSFYEFVEEFSLRPNSVKVIGYKEFYDKNSPYSTPVFSDKDLGWEANIENSYALEFLGREYDLLVNYYSEDKLLLQLMSIKTKARLKVGFGEVDKNFNDLILNTPIDDFKTFKMELKKYLRVLNEI